MISPDLTTSFDSFLSALDGVSSVVLTTHINPDGDGLGSQLALASFLRSRGKQAVILNHQPPPPSYRFLDPAGTVLRHYAPATDGDTIRSADMILIVDTNHPNRLGTVGAPTESSPATKVIIDHHLEPDSIASIVISDDGACAAGEIVYRLLEHAGAFPLSQESATALYVAIMTDTGSFRFPKTDADVHRIVAQLITWGADPVRSYSSVYEQGTARRLQLLGEILATLAVTPDGKICSMFVTREMFERTGTTEADTDNVVTMTLTIAGVSVGILISEISDGVKLNVRTKGAVPANEIAKAFGGNGHRNAAGARLSARPVREVLSEAIAIAQSKLSQGM